MLEVILLLVLLVAVGFGLQFMNIDPGTKNLIRGIVTVLAVLFVILIILDAFGVYPNPFKISGGKTA